MLFVHVPVFSFQSLNNIVFHANQGALVRFVTCHLYTYTSYKFQGYWASTKSRDLKLTSDYTLPALGFVADVASRCPFRRLKNSLFKRIRNSN